MKLKIPGYAKIPFLGMLIINGLVFLGTRIITDNMYHYDLSCKLDEMIPFASVFVIPYVCAYLQWIIGFVMIANVGKEHCLYIFGGEIIAKLIIGVIYIAFPTTIMRPMIEANDIFSNMVALIYRVDPPTSLFPSIHCLESWICLRGCIRQDFFGKKYKFIMALMTISVFLSTVLIKQHVIWDVISAVIVGELGLFLARIVRRRVQSKNNTH